MIVNFAEAATFRCERSSFKKSGRDVFYNYAKLVLDSNNLNSLQFYHARSEEALNSLRDDPYWTFKLQNSKQNEYSSNNLDEVKKHYGSAQVLRFKRPNSLGVIKVELQDRDYDSDYSGLLFLLRHYVIRGSAQYECVPSVSEAL